MQWYYHTNWKVFFLIRIFLHLFWFVFSCIQIEYRKIWARNNSVFGHFSPSVIFIATTNVSDILQLHFSSIAIISQMFEIGFSQQVDNQIKNPRYKPRTFNILTYLNELQNETWNIINAWKKLLFIWTVESVYYRSKLHKLFRKMNVNAHFW